MKRNRIYILLVAFSLFPVNVSSQEVLTGLARNKILLKSNSQKSVSITKSSTDTLELPFFDEFSYKDPYPADTLWSDRHTFVNNTYTLDQFSQGVATFDALNSYGLLHSNATAFVFSADSLTSLPINLEYNASDNLYLSFFYQAGGIADPPESADSLTLHFYSPSEEKWFSVWRTEGGEKEDFRAVNIRISDPKYLNKGFRFRFVNYASLSSELTENPDWTGNCDHWHIDYIYLDRNRTANDTIPEDVAFTLPLRSVLNTYEVMPWNQFREVFLSEMGSFININYRNNDQVTRNVTRDFEIKDLYTGNIVHSFSAGATNIEGGNDVNYNASLIYTYASDNPDSAEFRVRSVLITDEFENKLNDTIDYIQVFKNYFAQDDGSAEGGYGINGGGSANAMVATRFRSYIQDTLRSVMISFNDAYLSANQRYFDLAIWSDIDGSPGELLYEQEAKVDPGQEINSFINFPLNDPVAVNDHFFIGWKQRSETFLNVGLDLNTNISGRRYYYLNGIWTESELPGTLLIRPVLGKAPLSSSINDFSFPEKTVHIWPNPACDILNIDFKSLDYRRDEVRISIYDHTGRKVFDDEASDYIDISHLRNGIYILILHRGNLRYSSNKFIKAR